MRQLVRLVIILVILIGFAFLHEMIFTGLAVTSSAETSATIPECGNNVCNTGENCTLDAPYCTDVKCYEPTCEDGCGLSYVAPSGEDEACYNNTGCSGNECECDGTGNCVVTSAASVTPTGGGGGGGVAPANYDFKLSKSIFVAKLKQGEVKTDSIVVENIGNKQLDFVIDVSLKDLIVPSEYAFELPLEGTKRIDFLVVIPEQAEPDVYTGTIKFISQKIKSIPVIIEVLSKEPLFDVVLSVHKNYKKPVRTENVLYEINVINMGDTFPLDVTIEYTIKNMDNEIIDKYTETLAIKETLYLQKTLDTSELEPGDYIVYIKLMYKNSIATSSDLFTVLPSKIPIGMFRIPDELQKNVYIILIIIIIILTVTVLHYTLATKKKSRKK